MVRWVEDPALSLQQLGLLLWCEFDPWPGIFRMVLAWPKTNKQTNKQTNQKTHTKQQQKTLLGLIKQIQPNCRVKDHHTYKSVIFLYSSSKQS